MALRLARSQQIMFLLLTFKRADFLTPKKNRRDRFQHQYTKTYTHNFLLGVGDTLRRAYNLSKPEISTLSIPISWDDNVKPQSLQDPGKGIILGHDTMLHITAMSPALPHSYTT